KPLDRQEKEYNQGLSRFRVRIENVFAQMKVFRILSDRYRNKRRHYNIKFKIIAGIINMKNGFSPA
ncbi:MAG: IS5/IS1182 family transposase, partial [Anaplasmataceae bacterium]|nr:IS5/IS1182 family transposase [Anaplasmataceae bacterium]